MKIILLRSMTAFAAIILVGISGIFLIPAISQWIGQRNTDYAPHYAHDQFDAIQIGMPANSVSSLIGDPLKRTTASAYPVWALTESSSGVRYGGKNEITIEVLYYSWPKNLEKDYEMIQVCLGPNREVISKLRMLTD